MNKIIMLSFFALLIFAGGVFAQDTMNTYISTDPTTTPTVSVSPSVSPTMTISPSPSLTLTLTPTPTTKVQTEVGIGGGPDDSSLPSSAPRTGAGGLSY